MGDETNWSGNTSFRAGVVHRPRTIEELRAVVLSAAEIRAIGSRHSFNDLADSAQLVSLERFETTVSIDEQAETVTVSAGMRYAELAPVLQSAGWALRNLASLAHITIAGAVSTATHGSGDRNGTLSRAVCGLDLITADGSIRSFSPADAEFDGAVVSLGALGIVTSLTLDIEPSYDLRQDVYEGLSWDSLTENYDAIAARAYSTSIFTRWGGRVAGAVWLKSRIGERTPPAELYGAKPATRQIHPVPGGDPADTTPQLGKPGPWLDRLPHFSVTPATGHELQSEYSIPREYATAAIRAMRGIGDRIEPHLKVSELRSVAADSLWLSGAYERDALNIHLTWKFEPRKVAALLPVIEDALAPFDARPHWGKLFDRFPRHLLPRIDAFRALADELDPDEKFRNDFLRRTVFVD